MFRRRFRSRRSRRSRSHRVGYIIAKEVGSVTIGGPNASTSYLTIGLGSADSNTRAAIQNHQWFKINAVSIKLFPRSNVTGSALQSTGTVVSMPARSAGNIYTLFWPENTVPVGQAILHNGRSKMHPALTPISRYSKVSWRANINMGTAPGPSNIDVYSPGGRSPWLSTANMSSAVYGKMMMHTTAPATSDTFTYDYDLKYYVSLLNYDITYPAYTEKMEALNKIIEGLSLF